ncbi:MAG: tripartite tricarboxylate transporter substrate binding protein [Alphaproteobacteria bacterium]|nr:tripartite tricarboxylate transporter substrate binding protein [Alphaproteobacteria bacterium]
MKVGIGALCRSLGLSIGMACLLAGPASAQDYPTRPIRLVVPHAEGSVVDGLMRILAPRLADGLGQTVGLENRTGRGGAEAAESVARAGADGHTLMIAGTSSHAIAPATRQRLGYHPVRDFTAIGQIGAAPMLLLATPALPVRSVAELIDYARAHPYAVSFASSGRTGLAHLAAEQFRLIAGINLQPVAYKSLALALPDLMTGQVSLIFEGVVPGLAHARSGALRPLAVTSEQPTPLAPGVPAIAEAALPNFAVVKWIGLVGPAGLPDKVRDRLQGELNRALRAEDVRQRFHDLGMEVRADGSDAFDLLIRREFWRWSKVAGKAGIGAE